jgi:protein O-GlcNAc transferase
MQLLDQALDAQKNGRFREAEELYRNLIFSDPRNFDALHMLGVVCYENGKATEAEQFFLKALSIDSGYPPLFHNYGLFLGKQKRYAESIAQFDAALKLFDKFAPVYSDRGISLMELGKLDESLESHNTAVMLAPNVPIAYYNRANTLFKRRNFGPALQDYDRAIALRADYADAHCGRGNVFRDLKRFGDALLAYEKALSLAPDLAEARLGRGNVFRDLGRYDEAFLDFDKALALKADLPGIEGDRLDAKSHLCDWSNFAAERAHLVASVRSGNRSTSPFPFLAISLSPQDELQCAKQWVSNGNAAAEKSIWQGSRYRHDRIRVGYVSADFRQHAVSTLAAGMFECHDKSRFDVTAISIGPEDDSHMRQRVKASFEHFVEARNRTDDDVCQLIKDSEIDILVDLMGFTADSRTNIFARRPAPIQVNYLGYPGTMGAPFIDYILADRIVIPDGERGFYSEQVVYLPNTFMPGDRQRRAADKLPTRAELGLPERSFVFCCFNNGYKITPDVFDVWMHILGQTEGSVLWLFAENPTAERNLRKEAVARGVDAGRLIAAPRVSFAEHQARLHLADLFLDTSPYSAGATASDALWAGLPVLTRMGQTLVGRMAASLLTAIGMPELVTASAQDYESLACALAAQPERFAEIKRKLAANRLTMPLFDTATFTKHIEAAYTTMWGRDQRGDLPQGFAVSSEDG